MARQAQNYQAALQAAESGSRTTSTGSDNNTTYYTNQRPRVTRLWRTAFRDSSVDDMGASIRAPGVNEWFRYYVKFQNTAQTGVVYLRCTGAAGQNPTVAGASITAQNHKVAINAQRVHQLPLLHRL